MKLFRRLLLTRRLWYRYVKATAFRQIVPGQDVLHDEEIDGLGRLYQNHDWKHFQKYLDLSRKQLVDSGFPVANDLLALGEVKGNLNMCNLIESDMAKFNEDMQQRAKLKTVQSEVAQMDAEEDDSVTF